MWGPPEMARSETSPFFVDYVPGTVLSENMAPAEGFRDAQSPDSPVDGAMPPVYVTYRWRYVGTCSDVVLDAGFRGGLCCVFSRVF